MNNEEIICLIFGLISFAVSLLGYYFYIRSKLSANAPSAISDAEQPDMSGAEKLKAATDILYCYVPKFLYPFFTRKHLETIVQFAFDKVKEFAEKQ